LYDRYFSMIQRQCFEMVKEQATAQDLAQDVMVKAFLKFDQLKEFVALKAWLMTMTRRHCLNFLKKAGRLRTEDIEYHREDLISTESEDIAASRALNTQLKHLQHYLKQLSPNEREVLLLRYRSGHSVKVIAEALGLHESAVKMRLKRGRDRLAAMLTSREEE
jgi:RNA polymerase sigma-70 factor (ECF subfamily)